MSTEVIDKVEVKKETEALFSKKTQIPGEQSNG